ncbi:MAG: FAD-dependent oxidoreductase [Betaproteobacteria bacterium]|nr:FAD-dependent oxidoreductase [Betaproteobacteria bacterium]
MSVVKYDGRRFETHIPVLIVGAGACGSIAALSAQGRGVEVLLLERDAKASGNTALSGGQIPAGGTSLQRSAGLMDDTPELLFKDLVDKSRGGCDVALARLIAHAAGPTVEWLAQRHGIPITPILDFQYPGHSRPHMHATPSRAGAELLSAMLAALDREGIALVTSAQVCELYADDDKRIRAARVRRPDGAVEEISCDALILACNGFGGDKAMLERYIPAATELFYEGHAGNQGDAVRWGEALGASIKDMGAFQGHGALAWPAAVHLSWPTVTEGGFHVNNTGRRFCNENTGYSEHALRVHRQPGHQAWAIWDGRCEAIAIRQHSHQQAVESGCVRRCESITALAAVIGCEAAALERSIGDVAACAAGLRKEEFGRDFTHKPSLCPPYYVSKIVGALTHTQGGLEIDTLCRVLDRSGRPLPNLFAGGGAARGLSGPADWGYLSGSGLLMATVTGRLAGEAAADLVHAKG